MSQSQPIGTWVLLLIYGVLFFNFDLIRPDERLLEAGALQVRLVGAGEYWRLLSAAFVHIGFLHLAFNAYFLWSVGPVLERELGLERFLILYLLTGIGGNVAACLFYGPHDVVAGGSGSLFGFMGALVAMLLRQEHSYRGFLQSRAGRNLIAMILINLVIGWIITFISNTAHIGGLITGFLVAFFWFRLPEAGQRLARPPLLPAIAFLALFGSLTLVACRPIFSTWYQARALWFTTDEARASALLELLEERGAPVLGIEFLDAARQFRNREGNGDTAGRIGLMLQSPGQLSEKLARLGLDPTEFNPFIVRLRERKDDPGRALPYDPWLVGGG